jgi:hypothetical protein
MEASRFFGYAAGIVFTYPNVTGLHIEQVQDGWQISVGFGDNQMALVFIKDDAWATTDWWELIKPLSKEVYEAQGLAYE